MTICICQNPVKIFSEFQIFSQNPYTQNPKPVWVQKKKIFAWNIDM